MSGANEADREAALESPMTTEAGQRLLDWLARMQAKAWARQAEAGKGTEAA